MIKENILVVDDDPDIVHFLKIYIESEDYGFYAAGDIASAQAVLKQTPIDLILLDVLLPDGSGFDACAAFRTVTNAPIIFLSCKNEEIDTIYGLSAGGDDYVTKPFLPGELIARIRSNLRRAKSYAEERGVKNKVSSGGLSMDILTREVEHEGQQISLLPKEFDILLLFLRNPGRIFSKEEIFDCIWKGQMFDTDVNTVMVHISNLRKKLNTAGVNQVSIVTTKGIGYKLIGSN